MTSDLIDSLEAPVIPPSGFLGPTLEDYLAAHASSRSGKAQFTLDPCPKDLPSRAVSGLSPPVPSTALIPFQASAPVDFYKCFKGKEKISAAVSAPVHVPEMPAARIFQSAPSRGYIDKGKRPICIDSSDLTIQTSVQPSVGNNILATTIHNIGLAAAPKPPMPRVPFLPMLLWKISSGSLKAK